MRPECLSSTPAQPLCFPSHPPQGDILEDIPLIENLEETKRTAVQIAEQVKEAKQVGSSRRFSLWERQRL